MRRDSGVAHGANNTGARKRLRRRIDLVRADILEGLTRLRCRDQIIESARDFGLASSSSLPQYLFALTPTLAQRQGAPGGEPPSATLQTIIDTVLQSSPPMPNQYVAILIFPPPQLSMSPMISTQSGLEFDKER